jgi:2-polyprenyl-3-methyl-5-hydroxy-6-metoxy-1,4-benzoquinol methylase
LVKEALSRSGALEGADVLEIGCGSGEFAAWMAASGAHSVIAEDFSPAAVEIASQAPPQRGLSFAVGDIQSIIHVAERFDLVISCETIEHVPNPSKAVRELARVLKPGGTVLLTTPNYLSITGAHRIWREATGRKWDEGGQPLVNWTLHPRTARWVRRAGLKVRSTSGNGWYLPVPRRNSSLPLEVPISLRRWVKLSGLHVLIEATKGHDRD